MIVPLKRDGNLEEWAIIELQGDLKFDCPDIANALYIGDVHHTKSDGPILIIGIHILHGKEVNLPKPFAVLEKKNSSNEDESNSEIKTTYDIKAIVKKKLVFKNRPKPIITNIAKIN